MHRPAGPQCKAHSASWAWPPSPRSPCKPHPAQTPRAPVGPIEITVGTGAGGTPDVVMRQVAKVLNESGLVPNPIVVQNPHRRIVDGGGEVRDRQGRPRQRAARALAGPIWGTPITQGVDTFYDKVTPIAMFVRGEVAVAVHGPDSPINNLERARSPGRRARAHGMKIAGAQVGAVDHIVTGMIREAPAMPKFNYILFDGGGAAQIAFLGRNSDMIVLGVAEAIELRKQNKIKVIALFSEQRRPDLELGDVPTAREQGYGTSSGIGPGASPVDLPGLDPGRREVVGREARRHGEGSRKGGRWVKDNWWTPVFMPSDMLMGLDGRLSEEVAGGPHQRYPALASNWKWNDDQHHRHYFSVLGALGPAPSRC